VRTLGTRLRGGSLTVTGGGSSEPSYQAGVDTLIFDDSFESYASFSDANQATNGYNGSNSGAAANCSLLTSAGGPNGSKAIRYSYGVGAADDILFGPQNITNGLYTYGAQEPFTEMFCKLWVRWSPGADPANVNFAGIKGFMFWDSNFGGARYEAACNRVNHNSDGITRWLKFFNPSNAESGLSVWKTADGKAPVQAASADGNWHRVVFHGRAGAIANRGFKVWLDGSFVYDDQGVDVVTGQGADGGYDYSVPIGGFQMFGNFIDAGAASNPGWTLDVDRWQLWRP